MTTRNQNAQSGWWEQVVSPAGYILAFSYPVLALSTGVRAAYQLCCKVGVTDYFPPTMSAIAALCYLAAAGFAYRRKWTWWFSLLVLSLEMVLTLIMGTWEHPPA